MAARPRYEVRQPALLHLDAEANPLRLTFSRGNLIERVEFIHEGDGVIEVGLARSEQAHQLV
jgi:hypothetical protein